ncbi:hypothetical protein PSYAR_23414 [Pseudomonas syringae pv. aceris str. M302273]|nr:hypothetical protein PSYAR_23414 [Pseudomonas syringae pv. aceris str. M302273]
MTMHYLKVIRLNPVTTARKRPREEGRKTTGIQLNAL